MPFVADDWLPLLHSPVHEYRLACLVMMAERAARGSADEQTLIYETYLANTEPREQLGPGRRQLRADRRRLPARSGIVPRCTGWRARGSLWERRIAIVSTHRFIRAGESADTYATGRPAARR